MICFFLACMYIIKLTTTKIICDNNKTERAETVCDAAVRGGVTRMSYHIEPAQAQGSSM